MITIYKRSFGTIRVIPTFDKNCWVNIIDPTPKEINKISSQFKIPPDFFTEPLDKDERARFEKGQNASLVVLRVPEKNLEGSDIPYITVPLGIILMDNMIVTVCSKELSIIDEIRTGKLCVPFDNKSQFLFMLFKRNSILYLNYLKEINKQSDRAEKELEHSMRNKELTKLLDLEKSLVYFTTSLRANELMMERMQRGETLKIDENDREYLDDAIIENKQAIEMAEIYSNILSGMMDAFASIISNNLNVVLKFLTAITIILMIPTWVASLYGMNVDLPFQRSPYAFWITLGISFILSLTGALVFYYKRWF